MWEDKWHVLGDMREGSSCLLLTAPQCLCSESCHEINLHHKNMSLSVCCFTTIGRVTFNREEKQDMRAVRAPEHNPSSGAQQTAMEKQQQLLKSCFSSPHLIEKSRGKGRKDRRKPHKLQREKKTEAKPKSFYVRKRENINCVPELAIP